MTCECGNKAVTIRRIRRPVGKPKVKVFSDNNHALCHRCHQSIRDSTREVEMYDPEIIDDNEYDKTMRELYGKSYTAESTRTDQGQDIRSDVREVQGNGDRRSNGTKPSVSRLAA